MPMISIVVGGLEKKLVEVEIGKNTLESPGELKRLAVTRTSVITDAKKSQNVFLKNK